MRPVVVLPPKKQKFRRKLPRTRPRRWNKRSNDISIIIEGNQPGTSRDNRSPDNRSIHNNRRRDGGHIGHSGESRHQSSSRRMPLHHNEYIDRNPREERYRIVSQEDLYDVIDEKAFEDFEVEDSDEVIEDYDEADNDNLDEVDSQGNEMGEDCNDYQEHRETDKDSNNVSEKTRQIVFHVPPVISIPHTDMRITPFNSSKYIFSNQFPCPGLKINNNKYISTEHYYLYRKALYFNDTERAQHILEETDAKSIREIEREIVMDNSDNWKKVSWKIMLEAQYFKFKQYKALRIQLFRTLGTILVDANPHDTWWGVGLDIDDQLLLEVSKWRGHNVLGSILCGIRDNFVEYPQYAQDLADAKKQLLVDLPANKNRV